MNNYLPRLASRRALRCGLLSISALSLLLARRADAAPISVKCIGEQTTMTAEMLPTWPVQMQTDLGTMYAITNDGDGGGTVLVGSKGGTHTFATATNKPFADSIMSPDIVVIGPWAEHDEIAVEAGADATHFQADYDALVMDYLNLAKKPCVIVTTPVLISTYQRNPATDMLVTNTILPAVQAVAKAHQLPVVDLYTTFMGQAAWLGPDGHFTAAGAKQVAKLVEAALPGCTTAGNMGGADAGGGAAGAGGNGGSGGGAGGASGEPAMGGAGESSGAGGMPSGSAGSAIGSAGDSLTTGAGGSKADSTAAPASSDASSGCACTVLPGASHRYGLAIALLGLAAMKFRRARKLED